jgi:AraC-like DNA-binding protein
VTPKVQRFDNALGRWTLLEWAPPQLARWIDLVWLSDGVATFPRKRIFPNGRLELIVNLGVPMRLAIGAGVEWFHGGTISGVQTGPLVIEMDRSHRVLGVRLRPGGARALLGRPIDDVSDWTVDLGDVVGRAGAERTDRCHRAVTPEECMRRAVRWMWSRIAPRREQDAALAWAADRIERSDGATPLAALQSATGMTRARFAAAFRGEMGVSPKRYARIFRFRRALALVDAGKGDLGEVALAAGYYDQSHMNADFRELAGMAPGAFRATPRYASTLAVPEAAR